MSEKLDDDIHLMKALESFSGELLPFLKDEEELIEELEAEKLRAAAFENKQAATMAEPAFPDPKAESQAPSPESSSGPDELEQKGPTE